MRRNLSPGKKIRVMRIIRGIEQEKFAQMVGVSYQTVSSWENDHHIPHDRNMERIKAALHWPSDEDQVEAAFSILRVRGMGMSHVYPETQEDCATYPIPHPRLSGAERSESDEAQNPLHYW